MPRIQNRARQAQITICTECNDASRPDMIFMVAKYACAQYSPLHFYVCRRSVDKLYTLVRLLVA